MSSRLLLLILLSASAHAADTEIALPEIVKEGTPVDVLNQDAVLPAKTGKTPMTAGSGSIGYDIGNQVALPVTDSRQPGTLSQFRGLGKSAEDVDVQTLGIPLNPPQGGGFDLSTFPQFLWSDYTLQLGPSQSALDPRGVAGTLNLVPWSVKALTTSPRPRRVTAFYSGAGQFQGSGAFSSEDVALVAGYSAGEAHGPSGVFSGKWAASPVVETRFHLLASQLDVEVPGTRSFPTPNARQLSYRIIPVAQADVKLGGGSLLKSSLFYDAGYIRYDNPDDAYFGTSRDQTRQVGVENAFLVGDWKLGLSGRRVHFQTIGQEPPVEWVLNTQATRTVETDFLLIDPTVQIVGVSRYGLFPQGSLGFRRGDGYARFSYSRRFPTFIDRYYNYPPYSRGNPDLRPEQDWTGTLGWEWRPEGEWKRIENLIQLFGQIRQDVAVNSFDASGARVKVNAGRGSILALMDAVTYRPVTWLDLNSSLTFTRSNVSETDQAFQEVPEWLGVIGARAGLDGRSTAATRIGLGTWLRAQTSSFVSVAANPLPGYATWDAEAWAKPVSELRLSARLENILNRSYESTYDVLARGRTLSVSASGEF